MVEKVRDMKNIKHPEIPALAELATISFGLKDIPEIKKGDNIAEIVVEKMKLLGGIKEQDIFVIASKIVSKSEGMILDLKTITPSEEAKELSNKLPRKSPEICQLILENSLSYKIENNVIVAKHKKGFSVTSAGVDRLDKDRVIILPEDPDLSAKNIMNQILKITGKKVAIVISDSEGKPDREGAGAIAIGVAGIDPLRRKEISDGQGGKKTTEETISDMLAAQGSLLMGQRGTNIPAVCIRGFSYEHNPGANLQSIIHK